MVKSMGLVAASTQLRIRASGFAERDFDFWRVVRTRADAPSLMAEALAAVTVPFFLAVNIFQQQGKSGFGKEWGDGVRGGVLEYWFELWDFFEF